MRDFYKVLGITAAADGSLIKSAFRRRAKAFHPDLHPGDRRAGQRFGELTQAYQVLRNARTRAAYDAFLADGRSQIRQRVAASAVVMIVTFTLTVGSAYAVMALHETDAPTWGSSRHAIEKTASAAVRQVERAADAVVNVAGAMLSSATRLLDARTPAGTQAVVSPTPERRAPAKQAALQR